MSEKQEKQTGNQSSKKMLQIIMAVAAVGFLLCVGYIVYYYHNLNQQDSYYDDLAANVTNTTEETAETGNTIEIAGEKVIVETVVEEAEQGETAAVETSVAETTVVEEAVVEEYTSPIDFEKLQTEENADIYAWIRMENTVIDYPVLQHPTDDSYYLMHNVDGSYGYPGCIYAELYNTNTFEDPVTVLYGHNMKNGTMFGGLHAFEDAEYFASNTEFSIYMPEKELVYEIIAAKEVDDKRITVWYNFEEELGFQSYIDELMSGEESELCHIRRDVEITPEDNLVVLQTCVSERKSNRYVVVGVLREVIE